MDVDTLAKEFNGGRMIRQLAEDYAISESSVKRGIEHLGKHPALIASELFDRVQMIFDERDQHVIKPRRHNHYLRGLLTCRRCGSRLQYTTGRGNGGEFDYTYACAVSGTEPVTSRTCPQWTSRP